MSGLDQRHDPLDALSVVVRLLTIVLLTVLLLGGVYVAGGRFGEVMSASTPAHPSPGRAFGPPAADPVPDRTPAVPMRLERRFVSHPGALSRVVNRLDGQYRIVSYGYSQPNDIWHVEFERPKPTDMTPVQRALHEYLDGELPGEELRIAYRELHARTRGHGGPRITVLGTGQVRQGAFDTVTPRSYEVPRGWVEELVSLLLEIEAWEQYVLVDRPAVPTAMVTLEITAGDASSTIWELPRHRELDDRIARVGDRMKQRAWHHEQLAIIADE